MQNTLEPLPTLKGWENVKVENNTYLIQSSKLQEIRELATNEVDKETAKRGSPYWDEISASAYMERVRSYVRMGGILQCTL